MRSLLPVAAGAALLFSPAPFAQDNPCPAGAPIPCTYRVDPIPNAYASIRVPGTIGTVVLPFAAGADDLTMPVPLAGFPFSMFCAPQAGPLNVCTNGFANFLPASTLFNNFHPGDEAGPRNAIMPWHDDLILPATAVPAPSVSYNFGWYGPGSLVVEWSNVAEWTGAGTGVGSMSFQAVLWSSTSATPDAIEFRYDRATAPPTMLPCSVAAGGPSTFAVSATIGVQNAGTTAATNIGVEATDRGAANSVFPPCDLRLTPVAISGTEQNYSFTGGIVPQEPFCHIEFLPGTVAVGPDCAGTPCYDDQGSAEADGVQIPLPWKVNLSGRLMKHAQMDSNGFMTLGSGTHASVFANGVLPAVALPEATLAPWWDDLEGVVSPLTPSGMFYRVDGPPGCRVMTFEWHSFGNFVAPSGDCIAGAGNITFQVKIYEGSAGFLVSSTPTCPYDVVVPGVGNDRIEYHYDAANFVPGPFIATIGVENHDGTLGFAVAGSPALAAPPAGKVVIDQCDSGVVRYYGDPSSTCLVPPPSCLPELKSNAVPPRIGNPFAFQMCGANPGFALLNLFFGPPLPGIRTPVPCGGIPTGFGTLWAPFGLILAPTSVAVGPGLCESCAVWNLPIPANPALVGAYVWAQGANVVVIPPMICFELTEGAKVIIGA